MRSVERLVAEVLLAICVLACNAAHTETSTETGNPPVIDLKKISLVVSADQVSIVGRAGAVTPGGAEVSLEIVGTGEVTRGTSHADGSFDIPLDTGAEAVVEVSASDGDKHSGSVYVTRGGASVGDGDNGTLSCMQRSQLASQVIGSALVNANSSCQTAADCEFVSNRTVCTDSCGDALVSRGGVAAVKGAVNAVNDGLCASFAADGCNVIAQPCTPPLDGPIACVAGKCTQQVGPELICSTCLNQRVEWGSAQRLHVVSGCANFLTKLEGVTECMGEVAHCSGGSGEATIEALIRAIAHPDVRRAMNDGGNYGGPPAPGGMSTLINIEGRPFFLFNCSGPNCTQVPTGISALAQLLDRIATDTACDPPTCPPNGRYVDNVCSGCEATGCSAAADRCSTICSDSSSCGDAGMTCSERGICEFVCRPGN